MNGKYSLKRNFQKSGTHRPNFKAAFSCISECQVMLVKQQRRESNRCGPVSGNVCLPVSEFTAFVLGSLLLEQPNQSEWLNMIFSTSSAHFCPKCYATVAISEGLHPVRWEGPTASCLASEMLSLEGSLLWPITGNVDFPVFLPDWKRRKTGTDQQWLAPTISTSRVLAKTFHSC